MSSRPPTSAPARPRLWFTPDRSRLFLVPAEVEVPAGELTVRSLHATSHRFDEVALAAHEVDPEAARAHVDAGWERVPGVADLAAALFGVTPGELAVDPAKPREARRNLLQKASGLFGGWNERELDAAEARLDEVGETVKRDAARLRDTAEKLGQALEERAPELERTVEQAGQALADLLGVRTRKKE